MENNDNQAIAARLNIQPCSCEWVGTAGVEQCGCGLHGVRLYRDESVHYDGKHWNGTCLARHLSAHVETLTQQVMEKEKRIKKLEEIFKNNAITDYINNSL